MKEYSGLASYYDELNDFDYGKYADFLENCLVKYGDIRNFKSKHFVDYGCGTGSLSLEMAMRGFSTTALDVSEEELCIADHKAAESGLDIAFLKADMRYFATAREYILGASIQDSVNYLTDAKSVAEFLSSAYGCTAKGGIFVFDVNTKYRFENIYGDNAYVLESENALLAWQNEYNPNTKKCKFYLSLFVKRGSLYKRFDEVHTEKLHSERTLKKLIEESGFTLCKIYGSLDGDELCDSCEKAYYVLKKL